MIIINILLIYSFLIIFFYFLLLLNLIISYEIIRMLILIIIMILIIAFLTLFERKILSIIQLRRGPNIVGLWGSLQPIADAIKLILKETILSIGFINMYIFILSPIIFFMLGLFFWIITYFGNFVSLSSTNISILILFAILGLSVYSIIFSGWASNSKYGVLGGLRAIAQFLSYEISLSIIIMPIIFIVGSLNIFDFVNFQVFVRLIFFLWPYFILMIIIMLAETNRIPFDLPEAEAELVSGYNVEYSAVIFVPSSSGEYIGIINMSYLLSVFFFGGWLFFFYSNWFFIILKMCFVLFFIIIIRGTLPRYRYDQLIYIGWLVILPIALGLFIFILNLWHFI